MENDNIISIYKMMQFIQFYKNKLEQINKQKLENSAVETAKEVELEKKLQPLKDTLETLDIIKDADQAVTIIDEEQDSELHMKIETDWGTNVYSKINEHRVTDDGSVLPSVGDLEIPENEKVEMALDRDPTIHYEICKALKDIELFTDHSLIPINTTEDGMVFKFNLEEQVLVFRTMEKSVQSLSRKERKLLHDTGISKDDIPAEMMIWYEEFEKELETKKPSKFNQLIKKLGF